MAKKTTAAKSKSAKPEAVASADAPAPKPRARAKTAKKDTAGANEIVTAEAFEATAVSIAPTADDIRVRAYHRYLERGGGHGMDFEDWLEAERELRQGK